MSATKRANCGKAPTHIDVTALRHTEIVLSLGKGDPPGVGQPLRALR